MLLIRLGIFVCVRLYCQIVVSVMIEDEGIDDSVGA